MALPTARGLLITPERAIDEAADATLDEIFFGAHQPEEEESRRAVARLLPLAPSTPIASHLVRPRIEHAGVSNVPIPSIFPQADTNDSPISPMASPIPSPVRAPPIPRHRLTLSPHKSTRAHGASSSRLSLPNRDNLAQMWPSDDALASSASSGPESGASDIAEDHSSPVRNDGPQSRTKHDRGSPLKRVAYLAERTPSSSPSRSVSEHISSPPQDLGTSTHTFSLASPSPALQNSLSFDTGDLSLPESRIPAPFDHEEEASGVPLHVRKLIEELPDSSFDIDDDEPKLSPDFDISLLGSVTSEIHVNSDPLSMVVQPDVSPRLSTDVERHLNDSTAAISELSLTSFVIAESVAEPISPSLEQAVSHLEVPSLSEGESSNNVVAPVASGVSPETPKIAEEADALMPLVTNILQDTSNEPTSVIALMKEYPQSEDVVMEALEPTNSPAVPSDNGEVVQEDPTDQDSSPAVPEMVEAQESEMVVAPSMAEEMDVVASEASQDKQQPAEPLHPANSVQEGAPRGQGGSFFSKEDETLALSFDAFSALIHSESVPAPQTLSTHTSPTPPPAQASLIASIPTPGTSFQPIAPPSDSMLNSIMLDIETKGTPPRPTDSVQPSKSHIIISSTPFIYPLTRSPAPPSPQPAPEMPEDNIDIPAFSFEGLEQTFRAPPPLPLDSTVKVVEGTRHANIFTSSPDLPASFATTSATRVLSFNPFTPATPKGPEPKETHDVPAISLSTLLPVRSPTKKRSASGPVSGLEAFASSVASTSPRKKIKLDSTISAPVLVTGRPASQATTLLTHAHPVTRPSVTAVTSDRNIRPIIRPRQVATAPQPPSSPVKPSSIPSISALGSSASVPLTREQKIAAIYGRLPSMSASTSSSNVRVSPVKQSAGGTTLRSHSSAASADDTPTLDFRAINSTSMKSSSSASSLHAASSSRSRVDRIPDSRLMANHTSPMRRSLAPSFSSPVRPGRQATSISFHPESPVRRHSSPDENEFPVRLGITTFPVSSTRRPADPSSSASFDSRKEDSAAERSKPSGIPKPRTSVSSVKQGSRLPRPSIQATKPPERKKMHPLDTGAMSTFGMSLNTNVFMAQVPSSDDVLKDNSESSKPPPGHASRAMITNSLSEQPDTPPSTRTSTRQRAKQIAREAASSPSTSSEADISMDPLSLSPIHPTTNTTTRRSGLRPSSLRASSAPPRTDGLPVKRKASSSARASSMGPDYERPMSAVALRDLTSKHTMLNEGYFVQLEWVVICKEGSRPPSPGAKVRTVAQKEAEKAEAGRAIRAKKRGLMKGFGGSDDDDDDEGAERDGSPSRQREAPSRPLKHPRAPGDDEEYSTPKKIRMAMGQDGEDRLAAPRFVDAKDEGAPSRRKGSGSGSSPSSSSQRSVGGMNKKFLRWNKTLAVTADADVPMARSSPVEGERAPPRGVLRRDRSAYELDHLGNPKNVTEPLRDILKKDRIVVTKVVYQDDEEEEESEPEPEPEPEPVAKKVRKGRKKSL